MLAPDYMPLFIGMITAFGGVIGVVYVGSRKGQSEDASSLQKDEMEFRRDVLAELRQVKADNRACAEEHRKCTSELIRISGELSAARDRILVLERMTPRLNG